MGSNFVRLTIFLRKITMANRIMSAVIAPMPTRKPEVTLLRDFFIIIVITGPGGAAIEIPSTSPVNIISAEINKR